MLFGCSHCSRALLIRLSHETNIAEDFRRWVDTELKTGEP
jgi:hypothetical protein